MTMSILNIVGAKIWGGGEQYVYDMCEELASRNIPNYVLIDETNTSLQDRFSAVASVITGGLYILAMQGELFVIKGLKN